MVKFVQNGEITLVLAPLPYPRQCSQQSKKHVKLDGRNSRSLPKGGFRRKNSNAIISLTGSKKRCRSSTRIHRMYHNLRRKKTPLPKKKSEQSGTLLPPGKLIILVTRRPELSAILNWTLCEDNGLWPPFQQVNLQLLRSLVASRCYLEMLP